MATPCHTAAAQAGHEAAVTAARTLCGPSSHRLHASSGGIANSEDQTMNPSMSTFPARLAMRLATAQHSPAARVSARPRVVTVPSTLANNTASPARQSASPTPW